MHSAAATPPPLINVTAIPADHDSAARNDAEYKKWQVLTELQPKSDLKAGRRFLLGVCVAFTSAVKTEQKSPEAITASGLLSDPCWYSIWWTI